MKLLMMARWTNFTSTVPSHSMGIGFPLTSLAITKCNVQIYNDCFFTDKPGWLLLYLKYIVHKYLLMLQLKYNGPK